MISKLKFYSIDGCWWLGVLDGNKLIKAIKSKNSNIKTFDAWIEKNNLDELITLMLSKQQGYTEEPLNHNQRRQFTRRWEDMQEIKRTAVKRLENSYFQEED